MSSQQRRNTPHFKVTQGSLDPSWWTLRRCFLAMPNQWSDPPLLPGTCTPLAPQELAKLCPLATKPISDGFRGWRGFEN